MYKSFSDYRRLINPVVRKLKTKVNIDPIFTASYGGGRVGRKKKNVDGLLMVEGEGGSKITKMLTFG